MTLSPSTITKGFLAAGFANMSVILFSRGFTNPVIPKYDPVVMSNFGLVMIVIWGLAFISVAWSYEHVRWLVGVFAIEKLIYSAMWIRWMSDESVGAVFAEDQMAGLFFASYGVNDVLFCVFFSYVFWRLSR